MEKIRCVIIDDEALARTLVRSYLSENALFEVTAECGDGFEGAKIIQQQMPDLIFLDVQMPKVSGLEMLELIEQPPVVIFTTAYQEHAIHAFEKNAIDYLLKPFSKARFEQSLEKAVRALSQKSEQGNQLQQFLKTTPPQVVPLERVVVKTVHSIKVIPVEQIQYFEAQDDYVMIHTREGKFLKQQTMKYMEEALDARRFARIHRSYLVNIQEILRIEPFEKNSYLLVLKENIRLPISRSGYTLLKDTLDF